MKLLLFTEFFPETKEAFSGGVEARMYYLNEYLKNNKNLKIDIISKPKTHIWANSFSLISRFSYQLTSIKKIFDMRPEVLEASNVTTYIPGFIGAKLSGAKAIMWLPDVLGKSWFQHFGFLPATLGYISEWVSLRLPWDGVIFLSQATKNKFPVKNLSNKKNTVIYGGFDNKIASNIKPQKTGHPKFMVVSRLVGYKQVDIIINAFSQFHQKFSDAKLEIVGQGPEKEKLIKLVSELGLSENVIFHSPVKSHKQLLKMMSESTALISMSLVEGFGLVVVEALSVGTPFIHSDIPVTREITKDGLGGILVKKNSVKNLLEAMILVYKNNQNMLIKTIKIKQFIKSYQWETLNQKTLDFYKTVYED